MLNDVIAGIVTFNPDLARLCKNIYSISHQVQRVVVVDNNSKNRGEFASLHLPDTVEWILNDKNEGIAKALNQIFDVAQQNKMAWVVTLDQDTVVPENLIVEYKRVLNKESEVAILTAATHDVYSGIQTDIENDAMEYIDVDRCITSGSLNSVEVWRDVKGFDEYLFIDEVDHDYCHRVVDKGYRILRVNKLIIEHQLGESVSHSIFGKRITVRNHSVFRKYYIVRNILYLSLKYYGYVRFRDAIHAIAFILKTAIFEENRKEKVYACLRGMHDGLIRRK